MLAPYYHATNWIHLPAPLFASKEYNLSVTPESEVRISGVYEYHSELFRAIHAAESIEESSRIFQGYLEVLFNLDEKVRGKKVASYLRLLRGWLFDANSSEGAVLKGWVESRFGIVPFYHRQVISSIHTTAYHEYTRERMHPRLNRNMVYYQLDLLYAYTQTIIRRFFPDYLPRIKLYRGVNDINDHLIIERYGKNHACIEHNNLVSFSAEKEIAQQFGDHVMEVDVPFTKILFFSGIIHRQGFAGEMELLVIGGKYDTRFSYF
ncbi:NAD(+)--dinitrogen-reductase ADP-D-ribosyltransferase [Desulfurispirillum indicum S5]|uniref:NAD(+)--dinitrogen-reductase ADP-D-ribosyltransferase n=1 Tax=Desulfurispirillum indicum (strain ATCC BAA-1389 / DSM 22839 / S5) TaxID=653733 RepID=E6W6L5_DESIS|nr:NAD(+)--dinitrogen-reductase ADP-D-ribosyltransferase [Desulfurispirillum indicum]ADU65015.1 NAD(+)--dinitrogen-reductase ADP-D-ribosyltransferase [Desulfurispirillum indicum S5]